MKYEEKYNNLVNEIQSKLLEAKEVFKDATDNDRFYTLGVIHAYDGLLNHIILQDTKIEFDD